MIAKMKNNDDKWFSIIKTLKYDITVTVILPQYHCIAAISYTAQTYIRTYTN